MYGGEHHCVTISRTQQPSHPLHSLVVFVTEDCVSSSTFLVAKERTRKNTTNYKNTTTNERTKKKKNVVQDHPCHACTRAKQRQETVTMAGVYVSYADFAAISHLVRPTDRPTDDACACSPLQNIQLKTYMHHVSK